VSITCIAPAPSGTPPGGALPAKDTGGGGGGGGGGSPQHSARRQRQYLYIAEPAAAVVRVVYAATGTMGTAMGVCGSAVHSGDNGPAVAARMQAHRCRLLARGLPAAPVAWGASCPAVYDQAYVPPY
jgi:hypothetical protein